VVVHVHPAPTALAPAADVEIAMLTPSVATGPELVTRMAADPLAPAVTGTVSRTSTARSTGASPTAVVIAADWLLWLASDTSRLAHHEP
jgi:hypothetical protein